MKLRISSGTANSEQGERRIPPGCEEKGCGEAQEDG
jgi:hypothetical protein